MVPSQVTTVQLTAIRALLDQALGSATSGGPVGAMVALLVADVVLAAAFAARPERFPAGAPSAGAVPGEVWINKPQQASPAEEARQ
jgi:hypothetical protein